MKIALTVLLIGYLAIAVLFVNYILSNPPIKLTITEYTIDNKTHLCSDNFCYENVKSGEAEYCFSKDKNQVCLKKAIPFDKEGNIVN